MSTENFETPAKYFKPNASFEAAPIFEDEATSGVKHANKENQGFILE